MLWPAMRRQLARCAWGVGAVCIALRATPAQYSPPPDQIEAPEVRQVTFTGVKSVDQTLLSQSIATKASACKSLILTPFCLFTRSPTFIDRAYLDRTEFKRDVLRIRVFYWERGFREATVDTSITPHAGGGVNVRFAVTEGPPTTIARLEIDYDSTLISDRKRKSLTDLRAGHPLDLLLLDSTRIHFRNAMWDLGYGDATVDTAVSVDPAARQAVVSLRVIPNWKTIVGPISVSGNSHVTSRTILGTISLREGEPFKRSTLLESQQSLYRLNLFRRATISASAPGDSVKPVRISVDEAPQREAQIGGGFNNVDFFQLQGRFSHYNFLGGARTLDLQTTFSNLLAPQLHGRGIFRDPVSGIFDNPSRFLQPTWDASIDFRQPALLGHSSVSFGLGTFAHRRQAPGVFVDRGYGAAATLTRTVMPRAPVSLVYRYEISRVEASDVYYCVDFGVCDTPTIAALRTHSALSPLTLTGFVDRTDAAFDPTRGYLAHADFEIASPATLSDYRYARAYVDIARYMHIGQNLREVLAGHFQIGIVRPLNRGDPIHPRKRFYAGGPQSVRGYAENQLGPRVLTIDSASLRGVRVDSAGNTTYLCAPTTPIRDCDPNVAGLGDGSFQPQPLGGTSLVGGSVEFRFPLWLKLDGAVFVDGAVVGENTLQTLQDISSLTRGTGAITPGFGVRYRSAVGPIRVDLGINPKTTEELPVVTAVMINGQRTIVGLRRARTYSPAGKTLLNRLTLNLAVGQAF